MKYRLLKSETASVLDIRVNEYLSRGYKLHGSTGYAKTHNYTGYYFQAVTWESQPTPRGGTLPPPNPNHKGD
jgi:hypothetical protein